MRPILPNLFFESIYLGVVSSVHFRGWHAEVEHRPPGQPVFDCPWREAAYTFAHNLLSSHIALPSHAAGRDDYRVLGWSPDRHLAARRKVGLNFALDRRLRAHLKGARQPLRSSRTTKSARQPLDRRGLLSDNLLL
jgi:hypothetical protein